MKKKLKLILTIITIALLSLQLYALKLPTGQNVSVSDFTNYNNGNIKCITLTEPTLIDTSAGKLKLGASHNYGGSDIFFYENGKFKYGALAESHWIDTPAGKLKLDSIFFYKSGKFQVGRLAEDTIINAINYSANDAVGWDEQGKFLGKMEFVDDDVDKMIPVH